MAKRKQEQGCDIPEWVVTYGDLMSLLLCFFILLAAFSELKDPDEYKEVINKIKEALGYVGGMGSVPSTTVPTNSFVSLLEEMALRNAKERVHQPENDPSAPSTEPKATTIYPGEIFQIGADILFDPGSYDLTPEAKRILREHVAPRIVDGQNIVEVWGHSWDVGDRTSGLDHFTLSYRRAQAASDFLVNECGVNRLLLRPVAAGNTEPRSVRSFTPEEGRENRRVQVRLTERLITEVHPDPLFEGRP
ncbi:MAG: OmpA family protein [Phycisphaerales bacterium]|nr:OmpA family protein [Phycisphaerales bacterium]